MKPADDTPRVPEALALALLGADDVRAAAHLAARHRVPPPMAFALLVAMAAGVDPRPVPALVPEALRIPEHPAGAAPPRRNTARERERRTRQEQRRAVARAKRAGG